MNEFTTVLLDYSIKVIAMVAVMLLMSLYTSLKEMIQAKVGSEKLATFGQMAETTVRALEQEGLIRNLDGGTKFEIAYISLVELRDQLKLNVVTDDMIRQFIEASVEIINTEQRKFINPAFLPEPAEG